MYKLDLPSNRIGSAIPNWIWRGRGFVGGRPKFESLSQPVHVCWNSSSYFFPTIQWRVSISIQTCFKDLFLFPRQIPAYWTTTTIISLLFPPNSTKLVYNSLPSNSSCLLTIALQEKFHCLSAMWGFLKSLISPTIYLVVQYCHVYLKSAMILTWETTSFDGPYLGITAEVVDWGHSISMATAWKGGRLPNWPTATVYRFLISEQLDSGLFPPLVE